MVHNGFSCREDIERVVTRTTIHGDSMEKGDTTISAQKVEQLGGTVTVVLEVGSDWRGGLAHETPVNAPPLLES